MNFEINRKLEKIWAVAHDEYEEILKNDRCNFHICNFQSVYNFILKMAIKVHLWHKKFARNGRAAVIKAFVEIIMEIS